MAAVWLLAIVCTAQELPRPSGAINDFANVLSEQTEASLKTLVENVEQSTTAEIAVATVSTLDGTTVDDYAVRLFKAWGIGQKGRDNGVLVLVAPSDRQIRIEVGYGLEGVLPDGLAGVVIRESFLPPFRDGDVDKGVLQGVTRVAEIIRRNETLTAEQLRELAKPPVDYTPYVFVPFLGLFVVIGMGVLGAGLRDKDSFFRIFGSAFGGIPLLFSAIVGLYAFEILAVAALVAIAIGYLPGRGARRPARTIGSRQCEQARQRFFVLVLEQRIEQRLQQLGSFEQLERRLRWRSIRWRRSIRIVVNRPRAPRYRASQYVIFTASERLRGRLQP